MIDYDISTPDSAFEYLLFFSEESGEELIDCLAFDCDDDFETFWERHCAPKCAKHSLEDVRFFGTHISGSIDNCDSIRKYGLLDLKAMLSLDTPLHLLLEKYGVRFDIRNDWLFFHDKPFALTYDNKLPLPSQNSALNDLARRIHYDSGITAFFHSDNPTLYGTDIHLRPEFFIQLTRLLPQVKQLESYWIEKSKPYQIVFYATINQVDLSTFNLEKGKARPDPNEEDKIWHEMMRMAHDRAWQRACSTGSYSNDAYLYLQDGIKIPPEQLVSIQLLGK